MTGLPRTERPAFLALRFGSLALPLLAALVWGVLSWRDEVEEARAHAESSAALVAQYAERLVEAQMFLQDAARARLADLTTESVRSRPFHIFLRDLERTMPEMRGLMLMQTDGTVVASSRRWPIDAGLTMGPRPYLDAIRDGADLHLDRLIVEPTKEDSIVFATAAQLAGERLVLVAGVDSALVRDFLEGIVTLEGEAASLMRADGLLMIRNFDAPPMMLPQDTPIRAHIAQSDAGIFTTVAASDGIERIYAFRKVKDLPLYANFGTPTRIVLLQWLERAAPVWLLLAAIATVLVLVTHRAQRRVEELFELEAGRKRVEEAERLAEARNHLMRETNHRVKNNLALVVSLINMQMRGKSGIDGNELKARIGAISRVHDLMYRAADGVHVDFAHTLRELAESPAIVPQERGISVDCRTEPGIVLGPDQLTPLAVIAAELLTNAVKHAFRDRPTGVIRVALKRDGGEGVLEVSDDGVGMPATPQRRSGMTIVDALVAQIGGTIERASGSGALMRVRFPLPAF